MDTTLTPGASPSGRGELVPSPFLRGKVRMGVIVQPCVSAPGSEALAGLLVQDVREHKVAGLDGNCTAGS